MRALHLLSLKVAKTYVNVCAQKSTQEKTEWNTTDILESADLNPWYAPQKTADKMDMSGGSCLFCHP